MCTNIELALQVKPLTPTVNITFLGASDIKFWAKIKWGVQNLSMLVKKSVFNVWFRKVTHLIMALMGFRNSMNIHRLFNLV